MYFNDEVESMIESLGPQKFGLFYLLKKLSLSLFGFVDINIATVNINWKGRNSLICISNSDNFVIFKCRKFNVT